MFENKLSLSIQQDYHQAADNHRLLKKSASKTTWGPKFILLGALITSVILLF